LGGIKALPSPPPKYLRGTKSPPLIVLHRGGEIIECVNSASATDDDAAAAHVDKPSLTSSSWHYFATGVNYNSTWFWRRI